MRRWRLLALILALLAFALAALQSADVRLSGPVTWLFRGWRLQGESMAFFWIGVAFFLVAVWRRGNT